jgi:hypothetical protein
MPVSVRNEGTNERINAWYYCSIQRTTLLLTQGRLILAQLYMLEIKMFCCR